MSKMLLSSVLLAFCLFVPSPKSTKASPSEGELNVYVEKDEWRVLFNDFQEFYDQHQVKVVVTADPAYDGWYVGNGQVTGRLPSVMLNERKEGFLGGGGDIFYLGGCYASLIPAASLTFWDHPNVDIPGDGWGWGRIYGRKIEGSSDMDEDSMFFYFNSSSPDITPSCDACTDASPNCPKAGERHFWINDGE